MKKRVNSESLGNHVMALVCCAGTVSKATSACLARKITFLKFIRLSSVF